MAMRRDWRILRKGAWVRAAGEKKVMGSKGEEIAWGLGRMGAGEMKQRGRLAHRIFASDYGN